TGYYQLENISDGIYTFIASAAGYIQAPASGVAIVEGDTTVRDFTLAAATVVTPTPPASSPTPNPTETSIPSECEVTSIVVSPEEIELKKGQTAEVTVYLITPEGCLPISGEKVKATVKKNKDGKKKVSASPRKTMTIAGETYGEAAFNITAKKKKGTSKVKFKYNNLKTTLKVVLVK
ncbi:MAG: carboxypeptidase regulatory-like domain-containing protein, partial [Candidatus Kuenenia stuttgartiensis]|nr:carboxypeptidase regulatory-like domain-containing protein [Candidatus Kuenenia stuttgartiensis]